ncbi:transcription elongation factor GreAB [Pseudoalteromonas sp. JBTF-M23]|uniref:Transcription elongation factor GreAB n=1 Tax=Pseudoalteromonas caenipelagi TaxID=2726988 RepID=A0A849VAH5_9GAMM|nr:GreA/GreB family elongation factor [Pseudoalteromonas caenipelagi]NOU48984.1 transcription elongation factor GreAB [Pseudoalteromonas caenipelagi]
MNKLIVIEHIKFALEAKLNEAQQAAQSAHEDATHEQSVAETQYDSLSIESGYLAQGQSERVNEVHKSISLFAQSYDVNVLPKIGLGSLIKAIDIDDNTHWFYLGPSEGGLKVVVKGELILVITPSSPIGKAMNGKRVGDECEYTVAGQTYNYEILAAM